jgi:small subunit ribosomal protein S17
MPKRILTGKVTSNKADKTITVVVERKIMHPMYKKFVTKSKKFAAHDGENKFKVGDVVSIKECVPVSKNKRFEVIY